MSYEIQPAQTPMPIHEIRGLLANPAPRQPSGSRSQAARALLFMAALMLVCVDCGAAQDRLVMGGDAGELPSLPGEDRKQEADAVSVASGSIALTDRSFDNVVGVRLDGYRELAPAVVLEKGWLVSRKLGMGGVYTVRADTSELVLNGVYAPRADVRILLSASQTRMDGVLASMGGIDETLVQTGLLSSVRKQWGKSRVLPEAGFAVFTARAGGSGRQDMAVRRIEMGTLAGYMLRLAAMPMPWSRLEVSYQAQSTLYDNPLASPRRDHSASASVDYSQSFEDCSLIRGRYTAGPGLSRTDVRYEKGAFSVGFLQTRSEDNRDNALQFGYSLALDSGRRPAAKCVRVAGAPTPFRTIVDAATARPSFLPTGPLTRVAAVPNVPG